MRCRGIREIKLINKKMSSEDGASITFALLLFLVCAVISSIALVAGSTASGRLSKLAENDQRYYSVTSAAKMLYKLYDGQSVTIKKKTVTDSAGSAAPTTNYGYPCKNSEITDNLFDSGGGLLNILADSPAEEFDSILMDAACRLTGVAGRDKISGIYKLDLEISASSGYEYLDVVVKETLYPIHPDPDPDGDIPSNPDPDGKILLDVSRDNFEVRVSLDADIKTTNETRVDPNTGTITSIETDEITWTVSGMGVVNSTIL